MTEELCLYCNENGKKSCYPDAKLTPEIYKVAGNVVIAPLRAADGKFHKMQVVKCKWPDCL